LTPNLPKQAEAHMKLTSRHLRRTRLKRIIAAACVAAGFILLAVEQFAVHARGIGPYLAPFGAIAGGMEYLRSMGRRR
jgi:hypothetical protein